MNCMTPMLTRSPLILMLTSELTPKSKKIKGDNILMTKLLISSNIVTDLKSKLRKLLKDSSKLRITTSDNMLNRRSKPTNLIPTNNPTKSLLL